jgi:uncharacterized protein (DUF1778 family)
MLRVKNNNSFSVLQQFRNLLDFVLTRKKQSSSEEVAQPYRNDPWILSRRDSEIILDAIENPPAPSKALLSVFEYGKKLSK